MAWLLAAVLELPDRLTLCPAVMIVGSTITATGRRAAFRAPAAFAMPAPQVCVVQLHSEVCKSVELVGTWHWGTVESLDVGKGVVAPSFKRAMRCDGSRLLCTDTMSAAMADTIGAEKL